MTVIEKPTEPTEPTEAADTALNFVLCWHMHQPWYQQGIGGDYVLPWVYLHAIKDYEDMAMHLESHPDMHAVVNFAPILLEQLDDYTDQIDGWLKRGEAMRDPMLNLLSGVTVVPDDVTERFNIMSDCSRANAEKMIDPYPAFKRLFKCVGHILGTSPDNNPSIEDLAYFSHQYFIDLLMWYHIAWLGHSLKQSETSAMLIEKARGFDADDRRALMQLMYDCISSLIPRYRVLAARGQIELSMTPYCHPIVPLLNNMDNMRCAQPEAPMPECREYPGGQERSRWHIEEGIRSFEHYFGMRPKGVWLSEGAISTDAIDLIAEYGFEWTASGEGVWRNSMHLSDEEHDKVRSKRALFHPYRLSEDGPCVYFRDDGLSDLIGFDYSKRNSVDAAKDLVRNLMNIADFLGDKADSHVVSIILDGENAWEYYPHNGYYFLDSLYSLLENNSIVRTTTFSDVDEKAVSHPLPELCPGSWVYGSFSTWIGEPDKNRAWDLLSDAKLVYDEVRESGELGDEEQRMVDCQLGICEGSDWFWWFGDSNSSQSVAAFDILYRQQLKKLYTLLHRPVPTELDDPVSLGGGSAENAGTMKRNV